MSVQSASSTKLASHIPSLDGLRAFSVALVLIGHVAATHGAPAWMDRPIITSLGNIGVRFFFLISGFLITSLLMREHARHGQINLRHFYIRRAYRILPAALVYIGVIWACHLAGWIDLSFHIATKTTAESAIPDLLHALTFTANYNHDYNWYYNHLWSLSVEEQFYLLWPFVLLYLGKAHGRWACVAAMLACPVIRAAMYAWGDAPEIAMNREFQAIADALATSCLAALLHQQIGQSKLALRFLMHPLLPLMVGACLLAMGYGSALVSRPFAYIVGQVFSNLGIIIVLQHVIRSPNTWAGQILNWRPMVWVGTMSYSLYLWQEPFLYFHLDHWLTRFPLNLLLSFAAAWLSYRLIEKPFLKLREKLHPTPEPNR